MHVVGFSCAEGPRGVKVTDAEMATTKPQIKADAFHGEWNYTIRPRTTQS